MPDRRVAAQFRPNVSLEDWSIMLSALDAYRHNSSYRAVYDRMVSEAMRAGIALKEIA